MKAFILPFAVGLALLGSGFGQAGATVFSDGVFNDGDWDTDVVARGLANDGGTFDGSAVQVPPAIGAGTGNPDPYREVFAERDPDTATVPDNSTWVYSFYLTPYDPSVMGEIVEIDFAIDTIQFGGGSGGSLLPALRQDGVNYVARFLGQVMGDQTWTLHEFPGLVESDFRDPDDLSSSPDFSAGGGVIEFGWVYVVSTPFETPVIRTVGFDNWNVAIHTAIEVAIDIKPGSDPNSINLCSRGNVTVAVLTSETFDATTIDLDTATLADTSVRVVGTVAAIGKSGKKMIHIEDVDGDGDLDLVLQFATVDLAAELGITDTEAILNATTFDGQDVMGSDSIRIVKDC